MEEETVYLIWQKLRSDELSEHVFLHFLSVLIFLLLGFHSMWGNRRIGSRTGWAQEAHLKTVIMNTRAKVLPSKFGLGVI